MRVVGFVSGAEFLSVRDVESVQNRSGQQSLSPAVRLHLLLRTSSTTQ